jgi:hypothetical protein
MLNKILKLAHQFEALASKESNKPKKEKAPKKTSNLKEILSNLQKLETFAARKEYAEKCLKQISSGSSRIVFLLNEDSVLKLASNEKGLAQNRAEASVKDKSKYINPVTNCAKNYSWVVTPLGEKITEREFNDLIGVSFKDFGEGIKYLMRELSTKERKAPENIEEIQNLDIAKEVTSIGLKYKLMPGDIARISSWKKINNTPVLVDLGLTQDIYRKFYAKPKGS